MVISGHDSRRRQQLGPSLASFNGKLYSAWKGENSDQGIYYASYDGTKWSAQTNIAGVGTSVGPALATFNSKLYAVWKGENSDQGIYYASFDGTKWSAQTNIAGVGTSIGPALAEFNGKLYAMWKGENTDVSLWDAYFDGTKWSQSQRRRLLCAAAGSFRHPRRNPRRCERC